MGSKKSKRSSSAVDAAMAALMAGAAGFVVYAMPEAQFTAIVKASGLPQVVAAAQPPLGLTARLAAVAAAAAGTFLLVWLILRALAPKKKKPAAKRVAQPVEIEVAPPKLRRADAHPDAPARRPIFAGLDLGEPNPVPEAETAAAPAETEPEVQPEPQPELQPEPHAEPRGVRFVADSVPLEEATIPLLMQRLEQGLARREGKPSAAREEEAQAPSAEPPQIDERLRSAIHGLQQLARRG